MVDGRLVGRLSMDGDMRCLVFMRGWLQDHLHGRETVGAWSLLDKGPALGSIWWLDRKSSWTFPIWHTTTWTTWTATDGVMGNLHEISERYGVLGWVGN